MDAAAGTHQPLSGQEAIEKIRELAKGQSGHFGTFIGPYHLVARPMYTQDVDDAGALWFMSGKTSNKNMQLSSVSEVKLLYGDPGSQKYLAISGRGIVSRDQAKIDQYWSDYIKTWFPGGKDDPEVTLIKVVPSEAYYWDTQHGKLVSLLKIAASTITGAQMDDSREGTLRV